MFTKIFIKPVDFDCNLSCEYCYNNANNYRVKPSGKIMDIGVFSEIIESIQPYLDSKIGIVYHGGEALLAGKNFYAEADNILKDILVKRGKRVDQFIQTNATMVTDEWAKLLKNLEIWPSTSLDGPKELHDKTRKGISGEGTYDSAMRGYWRLRNTVGFCGALGVINKYTWDKAQVIFRWLLDNKIRTIDFLPCSPQRGIDGDKSLSVTPEQATRFYIELFDLWFEEDDLNIRIRIFFDEIKGVLGEKPKVCSFNSNGCKVYISFDSSGDAYHCGRYDVYKETCLGNIFNDGIDYIIKEKLHGNLQKEIDENQKHCNNCRWLRSCGGGCPFLKYSVNGNFNGVYSYCETRIKLFEHVEKRVN